MDEVLFLLLAPVLLSLIPALIAWARRRNRLAIWLCIAGPIVSPGVPLLMAWLSSFADVYINPMPVWIAVLVPIPLAVVFALLGGFAVLISASRKHDR